MAPYWKGVLYAKVGKKLTKFHEHGHHVFVLPKTRVAEQPKPPGSADFVLKSNLEAVTAQGYTIILLSLLLSFSCHT